MTAVTVGDVLDFLEERGLERALTSYDSKREALLAECFDEPVTYMVYEVSEDSDAIEIVVSFEDGKSSIFFAKVAGAHAFELLDIFEAGSDPEPYDRPRQTIVSRF